MKFKLNYKEVNFDDKQSKDISVVLLIYIVEEINLVLLVKKNMLWKYFLQS